MPKEGKAETKEQLENYSPQFDAPMWELKRQLRNMFVRDRIIDTLKKLDCNALELFKYTVKS